MKNPLSTEQYIRRTRPKDPKIRGDWFRDQTAIIHSQPFMRLKHKTQVFFAPDNDHICTRIEHILHVATIAKSICLGLNEAGHSTDADAAFAIGLGHDLGHAPFGHEGEFILDEIMRKHSDKRFFHEVNSYRVAEHIAENGLGLNLTYLVKDGIITHNGEQFEQYLIPNEKLKKLDEITDRKVHPGSLEGCIVRFSDKFAYLGRDIEDALTAGIIRYSELPEEIRRYGDNINGSVINLLVNDLITNSIKENKIGLSDSAFAFLLLLRKHNYQNIYTNSDLKSYRKQASIILNTIFEYFGQLYGNFHKEYERYAESKLQIDRKFGKYLRDMHVFYANENDPSVILCDYISGMTDKYVLDVIKQLTVPKPVI